MRKKAKKVVLYGLLGTFVFLVVAAGAGYWRLSQGPVSIGFLSGPLENLINANLEGMRINIRDAVIERDSDGSTVHLRLREAQLEDMDGQLIARAPRAEVGLDTAALLSGEIQPERLEFIGPRILVRRSLQGELELGFGETAAAQSLEQEPTEDALAQSSAAETGDLSAADEVAEETQQGLLATLMSRLTSSDNGGGASSQIKSISITNAAISIYDEINDAFWYAPKSNLVFQRVPYGVSLLGYGQVASGARPWGVQIAANYVTETERFTANLKISDFVPADISDEVFVLSDLAKVELPISGDANLEFSSDGTLLAADAILTVGAGHVGFPRYITQSLLVDEGVLHLTYVPETGAMHIEDSSLYVGGSRATINGSLAPVRGESGRIESVQYELIAQNVSLDTDGERGDQLAIDRFELRGLAALEEARLDVETLAMRAGDASVQVRGTFIEGPEVPAVYLRGIMRDVPLHMLTQLWPPEAASAAREWVVGHFSKGTVREGRLSVNLQSEALAAALAGGTLPDDQLTLTFQLEDVTAKTFQDFPALEQASGEGILRGNRFELDMDSAVFNVGSGHQVQVSDGRFLVEDLATPGTVGVIEASIAGESSAVLRLIDHQPLGYTTMAGLHPDAIGGQSQTRLQIQVPMVSDLELGSVGIKAESSLSNVTMAGIGPGLDIEGGSVELRIDKQGLDGRGRVVINGVTSNINWVEDFTVPAENSQQIQASVVLTESERRRLGMDLSGFLSGPVTVEVSGIERGGRIDLLQFNADLSEAELHIDAINWRRDAGAGATATFNLDVSDPSKYQISNLHISGQDQLSIQGNLTLDGDGRFASAELPVLSLGQGNRLAMSAVRVADGQYSAYVRGDSFDGRPLIGDLFGSGSDSGTQETDSGDTSVSTVRVELEGQINTLFLHNHEHLTNVSLASVSEGGVLQELRIEGQFADSQQLELAIGPGTGSGRTLAVSAGNAGAILRGVDLYSRVHGGALKLDAIMGAPDSGELQSGRLRMNDFEVIGEPALASLAGSTQGNQSASESIVNVTQFDRLRMSFVIDEQQFRIVDEAIVYGPTVGASARGSIGRDDGALNLAGTLTPAYALNAALGNVPILGQALMGGQGQGLIGVTFAVTGSMRQPRVTINPVSALAPGFLKRIFEFGNAPTQVIPEQNFEEFDDPIFDERGPRPQRLER